MNLETLKRLKHDKVKILVLRALRGLDSGGCHQSSLLKYVCSAAGVSTLRGQPREDFAGKVNKAVSALLREKPPKVEKPSRKSDFIRLTRKPKKRPKTSTASTPPTQKQNEDNVYPLDAVRGQVLPRMESYLVCPKCDERNLVNTDAVEFICRKCSAVLRA